MKIITDYLKQIPSSSEPLSADVFVIEGEKNTYLFDVGNNQEALQAISALPKEKTVILSHPHQDHIGNLDRLSWKNLYMGDATFEKLQKGTIVENKVTIRDGVVIEIRACPSPHTGGSLIATVNNEYTLLADLYFTRPVYDNQPAREMLSVLRELDTKYFVVSHQEGNCVFEKDELLRALTNYFTQ